MLNHLSSDLVAEITSESKSVTIAADTEILRAGQFVKVIPIVLTGLIKVYTRHEDRELLLYYIQPNESCVMSFAASIKNEPSKVYAQTEEETKALLLPVEKITKWTLQYPDLNTLFFQQYNLRYTDLLDTIHHVLFDKIDKRLFNYLQEKVRITGINPIKISHRQIANELGTVREVVSRVMKKLEHEGKLTQHSNSIEIHKR
jgi:CRP/FNR family transcriptional regulator